MRKLMNNRKESKVSFMKEFLTTDIKGQMYFLERLILYKSNNSSNLFLYSSVFGW